MQEFRVFRALGLAFRSWFRNFIPFTVLAAVLYTPAIVWIVRVDPAQATSLEGLVNSLFTWPLYMVVGLSTLLSPLLTYLVIQDLNGTRASIFTSVRFGLRGILPALILGVTTQLVHFIPAPMAGTILGTVIMCIWFVAAPSAVAEQLGPAAALSRSSELTRGRRLGIFGLVFLIGLGAALYLLIWILPHLRRPTEEFVGSLKEYAIGLVVVVGVLQMFTSIVAAVSYALLRQDKDGVTYEQLSHVFD